MPMKKLTKESLKKMTGVKATIQTANGTAKYIGTEVEENDKWNDSYNVNDGYHVIHNGANHHVYQESMVVGVNVNKVGEVGEEEIATLIKPSADGTSKENVAGNQYRAKKPMVFTEEGHAGTAYETTIKKGTDFLVVKKNPPFVYARIMNLPGLWWINESKMPLAESLKEKSGKDYSEAEFKMDKYMPDEEAAQDEFYKLVNKKDVRGLVAFFGEWADESRMKSYFPSGGNIQGFAKYLTESLKESAYTRWASTDEQEQAIKEVEKWIQSAGKRVVGGTTIGKSPQTVILDLTHHGSEVYINSDGKVEVNDVKVRSASDFKNALKEKMSKESFYEKFQFRSMFEGLPKPKAKHWRAIKGKKESVHKETSDVQIMQDLVDYFGDEYGGIKRAKLERKKNFNAFGKKALKNSRYSDIDIDEIDDAIDKVFGESVHKEGYSDISDVQNMFEDGEDKNSGEDQLAEVIESLQRRGKAKNLTKKDVIKMATDYKRDGYKYMDPRGIVDSCLANGCELKESLMESWNITYYVMTKDGFPGKKGDIIKVDEKGESSNWSNLNKRTGGSPFVEYNIARKITEVEAKTKLGNLFESFKEGAYEDYKKLVSKIKSKKGFETAVYYARINGKSFVLPRYFKWKKPIDKSIFDTLLKGSEGKDLPKFISDMEHGAWQGGYLESFEADSDKSKALYSDLDVSDARKSKADNGDSNQVPPLGAGYQESLKIGDKVETMAGQGEVIQIAGRNLLVKLGKGSDYPNQTFEYPEDKVSKV